MNAQKTTKFLQTNKNVFLISTIILLSLGLVYYIVFINEQTAQFFGTKPPPQQTVKKFPALDEKLNDIVNTENLQKAAEEKKLAVENKQVKVLITLKDESFIFTDEYGKEELRYGKYIQAYVKLDMLEKLAKNPKIANITAPLKSAGPSRIQ